MFVILLTLVFFVIGYKMSTITPMRSRNTVYMSLKFSRSANAFLSWKWSEHAVVVIILGICVAFGWWSLIFVGSLLLGYVCQLRKAWLSVDDKFRVDLEKMGDAALKLEK